MIQVLTCTGNQELFEGKNIVVNSFHDARSLDEFDINVINLNDKKVWEFNGRNPNYINRINDWESLSRMINNSQKTKIIILFPQNIKYKYAYNGKGKYENSCELKDMIPTMTEELLIHLYKNIKMLDVIYENTETLIGCDKISASFYFNIGRSDICTRSIKSDKLTTVNISNVILTTLNITSFDQLMSFLREIHLIEEKESVPEWIKDEKMFDDEFQLNIIKERNKIIETAKSDIENAMNVIRQNERYKSILYTSGDELVDVIFEILQDMLRCDLADFNDEKKEDFNFKLGDKVVIGEIKGITSNVKNANVSQLDTHVQNYIDNHDIDASSIVSLLVIDHQRNKPLCEREKVHQNAIDLANRNKSLIIETITILKMYERYLNSTLSREKIIEILTTTAGLLTIDEDE